MKHQITETYTPPSKGYKYLFDIMKVGQVATIPVKKNERDRVFHACRTRCAQVSAKTGLSFKAWADDHSVYYKREA